MRKVVYSVATSLDGFVAGPDGAVEVDFADLLRQPIAWDSFLTNAFLQGGYVAVFGALAYGRFVTRDVLS